MHIIFDRETAKQLDERYLVLELETIETQGKTIEAFCLVPSEKIVGELGTLDMNKDLHKQLLEAIGKNDTELAKGLVKHLEGQFGGELDTFYEEIVKRIDTTGSCKLILSA
jgi:hypothetical protein